MSALPPKQTSAGAIGMSAKGAVRDHSKLALFPPYLHSAGTNSLHPGLAVRSRHLILIVEDELWLGLDISEALEGEGYDVVTVPNADDAIKVLESRNDIHTIFTDIDLPGSMDGLKLAAAVRDRWPPVNIIVTTGMRGPRQDELPARSLFIAKPYRSAQVLKAVRSFE
jgi:two-component system, response regulator PdtaR